MRETYTLPITKISDHERRLRRALEAAKVAKRQNDATAVNDRAERQTA